MLVSPSLKALLLGACLLLAGASPTPRRVVEQKGSKAEVAPAERLLDSLLRAHPERFDSLVAKADEFEIQIIYTQIDRDPQNWPSFRQHTWHVDSSRYFNPASLVKLPIAVAALEKIHQYEAQGITAASPMATGTAYRCQTPVRNPFNKDPDRVASVANYVRRMLLVSDNEAYNRLYEFVGQDDMHQRLRDWGMPAARIITRFTPGCDSLSNRYTNPITFYTPQRKPVHQPAAFNAAPLPPPLGRIYKGRGYQIGRQLINKPFDFTNANYLTLPQVTDLLRGILFPTSGPELHLSAPDRQLLQRYLGLSPHESGFSLYRSKGYYDYYKKYLLFGRLPQARLAANSPRSFNIVGLSYGYVADCAYFADPSTGLEFMLSAVIYVNHDGILNDARYEYSSTAWPFMKALGEVILEFEKKRPRANHADLSDFRF